MKNLNQTVMGVFAPAAKPDFRGFLLLGMVLGGPVVAVLFGVEMAIRWALQMM